MTLYTSKVVAQWLCLTERRVRQLRDEGVIQEARPGLYDLQPTVARYIQYLGGAGKENLNEERRRLTAAKREAAEMDNELRRGDLHSTADFEKGIKTMLLNVRSRFLIIPAKLSPSLAAMGGDQAGIFDTLKRAIDEALLGQKRQTTFWDKKTVIVSTPGLKGSSRIATEYEESTREEWNVPCPRCGHYQPLAWSGIVFDKDDLSKGVRFRCEKCGEQSGEHEWKKAAQRGRFVAANPTAETRGFHLNTLASTFCGWIEVVEKFLVANELLKLGDPEKMKTWINTELGEPWEEPGSTLEENELLNRREIYDAEVPEDVLVLTAGVDVQDDRFEVEVVGWGVGKESWGIRYQKIFGDMLKEQVWNDLDAFLLTPFRKADGTVLNILAACIDSGGHYSTQVYRFTVERYERRVWAIKGKGGAEVPYIRNPTTNNRVKAPLFIIGVDAGKALLYQRLKHPTEGPNYCHFPLNEAAGYDEDYFKGLTAEKMVQRFRKGRAVVVWELKDSAHKRNEPLDLRNYATAALEITNPVLQKPEPGAEPARRRAGRRRISEGI